MLEATVREQVLSSALRLRLPSSALTRDFYDHLFRAAPDVRLLFPGDLDAQAEKLFEMILVLVQSLDELHSLEPEIRALGARHAGYGVTEAQYTLVADTLLETLSLHVHDWSPEDRAAWALLIDSVSGQMIAGADGQPVAGT